MHGGKGNKKKAYNHLGKSNSVGRDSVRNFCIHDRGKRWEMYK